LGNDDDSLFYLAAPCIFFATSNLVVGLFVPELLKRIYAVWKNSSSNSTDVPDISSKQAESNSRPEDIKSGDVELREKEGETQTEEKTQSDEPSKDDDAPPNTNEETHSDENP